MQLLRLFVSLEIKLLLNESLDSAFETLEITRRKIQENLIVSYDAREKQELEILLENVKSLRPMNACGYFEITKSTLASMLEVRYITLDFDILKIILILVLLT